MKSIGGFRTVPDYSFDTMPGDYAALVLVGGFGWSTPVAELVVPIVRDAIEKGQDCRRNLQWSLIPGKAWISNTVKHTGNGPDQLRLWGGDSYTNPKVTFMPRLSATVT